MFNRGNARDETFLDTEDFSFFLYRMKENLLGRPMPGVGPGRYPRILLPADSFALISYCLMPNHFHWLIRQDSDMPISQLVQKVCTSYAKYFNGKYERVGHIFQDRFKVVPVTTDAQLLWLSAYIHNNPVVAGVVEKAEDYIWSSYRDYLGLRQGKLCSPSIVLDQFSSIEDYRIFTEQAAGRIRSRKELEKLLLD